MGMAGGSGPLSGPGILNAFLAWQAATGGAPRDWDFGTDPTDRPALPLPGDLLFPGESATDKALADWLATVAPHLVQPVRLLRPAPKARGLRRLFGGRGAAASETLDPSDRLVSAMLGAPEGRYVVVRAILTDVTRLTIALARDAARRGGRVFSGGAEAAPAGEEPAGLFVVLARPWPEMAGLHELPTVAGPLSLIPLPGDLMLAHAPAGGELATARDLQGLLQATLSRKAMVRRVSEGSVGGVAVLRDLLPLAEGLSAGTDPLHDGEMAGGHGLFANRVAATWAHLDAAIIRTLIARHGASTPELLDGVHRDADLGEDFGGGLRAREVGWMMRHEWATDADSVLHRRGPFALLGADAGRLHRWMEQNGGLV